MKDYYFSEHDVDNIEFYVGQGLPDARGPLSFNISEASGSEEPVTWINGQDFTANEIVMLRAGKEAFEKLGDLLAALVGEKGDIPIVLAALNETLHLALVRQSKL